MPLCFPNVEPRVFWSTEMTLIPNQHWGGENHTSVSRFVTSIVVGWFSNRTGSNCRIPCHSVPPLFSLVDVLWRTKHNTIDAILIQWHANKWQGILQLSSEPERQLTTARTNQTTGLTYGRGANWAPEIEFSRFRARYPHVKWCSRPIAKLA